MAEIVASHSMRGRVSLFGLDSPYVDGVCGDEDVGEVKHVDVYNLYLKPHVQSATQLAPHGPCP